MKVPRRKRLRYRYTEDMKEASYQIKLIINREYNRKRRYAILEQRYHDGDEDIQICRCGKLYNTKVNFPNRPGARRDHCVRCPLKPNTRERLLFSKTKQEFYTRTDKR